MFMRASKKLLFFFFLCGAFWKFVPRKVRLSEIPSFISCRAPANVRTQQQRSLHSSKQQLFLCGHSIKIGMRDFTLQSIRSLRNGLRILTSFFTTRTTPVPDCFNAAKPTSNTSKERGLLLSWDPTVLDQNAKPYSLLRF